MQPQSKARFNGHTPDDEAPRPLLVIAILPSLATLGNLLCGFMAIFCCVLAIRADFASGLVIPPKPANAWLAQYLPTYVACGAYLIIGALICDALDGRLARMARRTTEFGAQLDSIADVVSFGAAPAMLFLTLLVALANPAESDPLVSKVQWRLGLLAALVYVSCAAIRLARYNAENVKDESAQQHFTGLPAPGAAAAFVALLLVHETWAQQGARLLGVDWAPAIRWSMAPMALALGALMVSRLDYVHVFNVYIRRERPVSHLIWLVSAIVIGWFSAEILLLVAAYAYLLSGLVLNLRRRLAQRAGTARSAPPSGAAPRPAVDTARAPLSPRPASTMHAAPPVRPAADDAAASPRRSEEPGRDD